MVFEIGIMKDSELASCSFKSRANGSGFATILRMSKENPFELRAPRVQFERILKLAENGSGSILGTIVNNNDLDRTQQRGFAENAEPR